MCMLWIHVNVAAGGFISLGTEVKIAGAQFVVFILSWPAANGSFILSDRHNTSSQRRPCKKYVSPNVRFHL